MTRRGILHETVVNSIFDCGTVQPGFLKETATVISTQNIFVSCFLNTAQKFPQFLGGMADSRAGAEERFKVSPEYHG